MKIVDCLKVLSILQSNQSINLGEIAKNTALSQKEVKEAIKYLDDSALISRNNGSVIVNVVKINSNN